MAKQPNIRWRKSDNKELQRIVNNYNAKIRRVQAKNPDAVDYLPQKITMKQAREMIETRADFKRVTASLQRFSERGAENVFTSNRGLKTTQWVVDEFKRNQAAENKRRAKKRKELGEREVKQGGKPTGAKRKEMGRIKENAVRESKKDPRNMSMEEFKKAARLFEKKMRQSYNDEQARKMQVNYIRGLIREGYSEELTKYLLTIPTDKFMEIVDTDESATFDFIYDPVQMKVKESVLWDIWEEHGTGKNELNVSLDDILYDELKRNS